MPDEAERRRQHDLARATLMRRYVRSETPRVKVRLPHDPLAKCSLLALALGVALILAGIALDPV